MRACPFCGGTKTKREESKIDHVYARRCTTCLAVGPVETKPYKADTKWDERKDRGAIDDVVRLAIQADKEECFLFADIDGVHYSLHLNKIPF